MSDYAAMCAPLIDSLSSLVRVTKDRIQRQKNSPPRDDLGIKFLAELEGLLGKYVMLQSRLGANPRAAPFAEPATFDPLKREASFNWGQPIEVKGSGGAVVYRATAEQPGETRYGGFPPPAIPFNPPISPQSFGGAGMHARAGGGAAVADTRQDMGHHARSWNDVDNDDDAAE